MKKCFIVLFSMVIMGSVLAISDVCAQDGLQVGTEVYFFNYEEPDYMEDTGVFFGVNAGYTQHFEGLDLFGSDPEVQSFEERSMIRWDGRVAYGNADYTSESTGDLDNINDFVFETRLAGGYDFNVAEKNTITPYTGIGYRYLYDDTSGKVTTAGASGYQRESNYLYVPIGADLYMPINERWDVDFNVECDLFIFGRQKSYLGDAISGLNTVDSDQNDGYGVRGSMRFTKEGKNTTFFVEPFVRYWHIDDSEISAVTYNGVLVGYGLEPENKTIEAGAKVGVNF